MAEKVEENQKPENPYQVSAGKYIRSHFMAVILCAAASLSFSTYIEGEKVNSELGSSKVVAYGWPLPFIADNNSNEGLYDVAASYSLLPKELIICLVFYFVVSGVFVVSVYFYVQNDKSKK